MASTINIQNPGNGYTPLHIAIENQHIEVIKVLLEYNADIYIPNNENITSFQMAMTCNNEIIKELLLNHSKKMNNNKFD